MFQRPHLMSAQMRLLQDVTIFQIINTRLANLKIHFQELGVFALFQIPHGFTHNFIVYL